MNTLTKNRFGIAIFHNIGDILLCTPIARQLKADDPSCHVTWYTSQRYAFVLDNNPYIDEVIALPDVPLHSCQIIDALQPYTTPENAGVLALNTEIPRLQALCSWTRFFIPAPYLNYAELAILGSNGSLLDIIKSYVNFNWTVSDLPVMRLTAAEVSKAREYLAKLPSGIKILIETEFKSSQSYFDIDCLFKIITSTLHLMPVIIFTSKNKPYFFDDISALYDRMYWFSGDFRLNAELYNACSGFVGVSSGVSTLTYSDWCRNDLPKLEASLGEHWSAYQRVSHFKLMPCYSKAIFLDRVSNFVSMLQESIHIDAKQKFHNGDVSRTTCTNTGVKISPLILIDGVFFQLAHTGIARLWITLLSEWAKTDFAHSIVLLNRAGTAPKIEGIRTRVIPSYDYISTDNDRAMLQAICNDEGAALFVSTYYTTPLTTPSAFYAYDMIPENTPFFDLNDASWREKHYGIVHASAYIAISRYTAMDLTKAYPPAENKITIAYPAVDTTVFYPASLHEVEQFRKKYSISKPYFLLVGSRQTYKNAILFFEGFARLLNNSSLEILCVGGMSTLEPYLSHLVQNNTVNVIRLADDELRLAYSGAVAFVYPSLYEGFGLPVLEAMACDCPVITCQNSSIPEAAGAAALYVTSDSPDEMAANLQHVQSIEIRTHLIKMGRRQVQKFSWSKMADEVREALLKTYNSIERS